MEKPIKVKIIGILYLLAGISVFILAIIILFFSSVVLDVLNLVFPNGGFNAGDTFITNIQLYFGAYFLLPMAFLTGVTSTIAGYLFLTTDKKIAWYLTIASSILYCLILVGLIIDVIILRDDVRELFTT
ncbi:MAG: hypothetical protein ACTSVY_16340 [Candidatus Helarchaeota archaeon]